MGFRLLKEYIDKYPYMEALGAYNAGEGNRHSVLATYAAQLAGRHCSWEALLGSLEVLPETIEAEKPVTEYKEVTLRVGDQGWLYRENTDPIEWAKAPDFAEAELATDSAGWLRVRPRGRGSSAGGPG